MTIFSISLGVVGLLFLFQLLVYLRERKRRPTRIMLVGLIALLVIGGCIIFAWREALAKEVDFLELLPPYPGAHLNLFETPVFSDDEYWTYHTDASADEVFNWYRSRAKHANWTIEDQGVSNARVFVIVLVPREIIFVVLQEHGENTDIIYTKEGTMLNIPGVF